MSRINNVLRPFNLHDCVSIIALLLAVVWPIGFTLASTTDVEKVKSDSIIDLSVAYKEMQNLNQLSQQLVQQAQSKQATALDFRVDAAHYRERLRQLMLQNNDRPQPNQIPQTLLMDMVRMSALLHSAAECKTGRYIVCPVSLMENLQAQQKKILENISSYK